MGAISAFTALIALTSVVSAAPLQQNRRQNAPPRAQAVYFMDNQDQNNIHSLKVESDGTLSAGAITPTQGQGASGIAAGAEAPLYYSGPDSTYSTGAVALSGTTLLNVNPASNSVSMFQIDPADPLNPKFVGVYDTLGQFPNAVAISAKLQQACVTNIGPSSGVSCFHITNIGLTPIGNLFEYQLNQTYPPSGFTNGPLTGYERAILTNPSFSADDSKLIVTQTGVPHPRAHYLAGHVLVYPIANGVISNTPVVSNPEGTRTLFNMVPVPGKPTQYFATDPAYGSTILNIDDQTLEATTISRTNVTGQTVLCWSWLYPGTNRVFSTDALTNRLVEQDVNSGDITSIVNGTNGNIGMIDLWGYGDLLYALSVDVGPGTTNVVTWDVSQPGQAKVLQNFYPEGFSTEQYRGGFAAAKGLVVYPTLEGSSSY